MRNKGRRIILITMVMLIISIILNMLEICSNFVLMTIITIGIILQIIGIFIMFISEDKK